MIDNVKKRSLWLRTLKKEAAVHKQKRKGEGECWKCHFPDYPMLSCVFIIQPIKYIFDECFVVRVFLKAFAEFPTSYIICFSTSLELMCLNETSWGQPCAPHVELPVVPKEDRLFGVGGSGGSECQLRTRTVAVNLQRQQCVDTAVGGIWEDVTPIIYIRQGPPSKIR